VKRALFLGFLAVAVALAFALRADLRGVDPGARGSPYADLEDAESAYRLRLIELQLAGGSAPRHDVFLDAERTTVPWPPLVHGALGSLAATSLARDERYVELRGIEEEQLLDFAAAVGPVLGALATLMVAFAGSFAFRGPRAERAALAAAFGYALLPLALARETAGALHAHSWVAVLLAAEVASFAVAVRAEERIDLTLGALGAGSAAGLAQLAGPEAWPVSAAILGALVVIAARSPQPLRRDGWRAVLLAVGSALAVMGIAEPGLPSAWLLPDFSRGAQGWLACAVTTQVAVGGTIALVIAVLVSQRAKPMCAVLLAAALPSLACAAFDARFYAPFSVVLVLGLGAAVSDEAPIGVLRRRGLRWAVPSVCAAFGVAWAIHALTPAPSNVATRQALRWLREHSASPGAFNHGDARQTWRVACSPQLAGAIALHARRGVLASSFDGTSSASSERLKDLLRAPDLATLAVELAKSDCAVVVVTPRMLADRTLALPAGGAIEQLALGDRDAPAPEFVRVFATARRELRDGSPATESDPGAPSLSIYRRASGRSAPTGEAVPDGPTMRRDGER
jgi:hypothetical protein